jgi:hypothetical protein
MVWFVIILVVLAVLLPLALRWLSRTQQVEGRLDANAVAGTGHGPPGTERAATDRPADAAAEPTRALEGDATSAAPVPPEARPAGADRHPTD